jgi:hypothetical protein
VAHLLVVASMAVVRLVMVVVSMVVWSAVLVLFQ